MRFIVLVKETELEWKAYGVYRSFMAASRDAKAMDGVVIKLENRP